MRTQVKSLISASRYPLAFGFMLTSLAFLPLEAKANPINVFITACTCGDDFSPSRGNALCPQGNATPKVFFYCIKIANSSYWLQAAGPGVLNIGEYAVGCRDAKVMLANGYIDPKHSTLSSYFDTANGYCDTWGTYLNPEEPLPATLTEPSD